MKRLGLLFLCVIQCSCKGQIAEKINGISFVASTEKATQAHVEPVLRLNANYAAIMPFGFVRTLDSPKVVYDSDRQWFGETQAGAKQYAQLLKKNGIKVMLKPQIWVWRGEFTGDIAMKSEEDWKILEETYAQFILTYAKLAQTVGAEVFCVGTELEEFVKARPEYWSKLIDQVEQVYEGQLTYAANWDEYSRTPFWRQLDFIGVDAYFPLSEERHPTMTELQEGWEKWKAELADVSLKNGKPVLFTEFGYRSMDFTGKKPWLVDEGEMEVNLEAQATATAALFNTFWQEEWFAGGFVWKWFIQHEKVGGEKDNRFTPQNKPAETVIREYYGGLRGQ